MNSGIWLTFIRSTAHDKSQAGLFWHARRHRMQKSIRVSRTLFLILFVRILACVTTGVLILSIANIAKANQASSDKEIRVPLTVTQTAAGTYKANISVGIGNLTPLSFVLDTGSTGFHVFKAAKLDAPGSGVNCTDKTINFTVGNPGRITYSGVVCYAPLHFANYTSPDPIEIAYLTSAACTPNNPGCKVPNLNNPKAHGGYGVFGAGLTGAMPVKNPILALPAPLSSSYSIRLTSTRGELILGNHEPSSAAEFHLVPGNKSDVKWTFPQGCLFVNEQPTHSCLSISFDTGNGVPWIRDTDSSSIPQKDGLVAPGTRIGFAPLDANSQATSVVAGDTRASRIKVSVPNGASLTNTSIQVFLNHVFTYDNVNGVISVAPIR
jgi:hypothetical protein